VLAVRLQERSPWRPLHGTGGMGRPVEVHEGLGRQALADTPSSDWQSVMLHETAPSA
jgi:hypothetical protein